MAAACAEEIPAIEADQALLWQARARAFVAAQGWGGVSGEDLVSCMVLELLECPARRFRLAFAYLHARDHLSPRHLFGGKHRQRIEETFLHENDIASQSSPTRDPWLQQRLLAACADYPQGEQLLRIAILWHGYGVTQKTIAKMLGVHHTRVSQLLRPFFAHLRAQLAGMVGP
jgi:DNA-directed RNA polymerase specialized sigma24 family protein